MDKEPEFEYVTYIVTTPEKLWAALTNPELIRRYFFGRHFESDWKAGSSWTLRTDDGQIDSQGRVLECLPPRRLSLTWHVEWLEEYRHLPEVVVTYQIDPLGEVVRLTVSESHPEPIEGKYPEGRLRSWPVMLSWLKTFLETGRPMPEFDWSA